MCMVILFAEFCQLLSAQNTHTQKHKKKQEQKAEDLHMEWKCEPIVACDPRDDTQSWTSFDHCQPQTVKCRPKQTRSPATTAYQTNDLLH